ncbi:malic enzyme-like NAD(P)-binding protein [Streptomyces sp. B93]|uniref:malic enzyme-like NAD(P)-binding protein n=1 Tax=Streptomyces sp. B93 TaxID=2824875 RepID=UPI0027E4F158|nr:malic enzyme-like NAD(P)-binding protein [Streptomyces sp. B93]
MRVSGIPMRDQRLVVYGSGTAGVADQLHDAMVRDGADEEQATAQIWLVDPGETDGWAADGDGSRLLETVRRVKPTILLGTSTVPGAFTQEVVEAMGVGTERPIVLPLSNPTSQIEAMPADIIAWTQGKALVATGIPVEPVDHGGTIYRIGQANNALLYPGSGLRTIVAGASRVTDGMLRAAAEAVAGQVDAAQPGAALLPPVEELRESSAVTAVAVVQAAIDEGVAVDRPSDPHQAVRARMWQPGCDKQGDATA